MLRTDTLLVVALQVVALHISNRRRVSLGQMSMRHEVIKAEFAPHADIIVRVINKCARLKRWPAHTGKE